jgi:hypothetical protein
MIKRPGRGQEVTMLNVQVHSIPKTEEEKAKWKREDEICPMCQKPFGQYEQLRLDSGVTVHAHCMEVRKDKD